MKVDHYRNIFSKYKNWTSRSLNPSNEPTKAFLFPILLPDELTNYRQFNHWTSLRNGFVAKQFLQSKTFASNYMICNHQIFLSLIFDENFLMFIKIDFVFCQFSSNLTWKYSLIRGPKDGTVRGRGLPGLRIGRER